MWLKPHLLLRGTTLRLGRVVKPTVSSKFKLRRGSRARSPPVIRAVVRGPVGARNRGQALREIANKVLSNQVRPGPKVRDRD